jgi:hypothetical protein
MISPNFGQAVPSGLICMKLVESAGDVFNRGNGAAQHIHRIPDVGVLPLLDGIDPGVEDLMNLSRQRHSISQRVG